MFFKSLRNEKEPVGGFEKKIEEIEEKIKKMKRRIDQLECEHPETCIVFEKSIYYFVRYKKKCSRCGFVLKAYENAEQYYSAMKDHAEYMITTNEEE